VNMSMVLGVYEEKGGGGLFIFYCYLSEMGGGSQNQPKSVLIVFCDPLCTRSP